MTASLFNAFLGQTGVLGHRDEMARDLLEIARKNLHARACSLRFLEGDRLTAGVAVGYPEPERRMRQIALSARLEKWLKTGEPWLIPSIESEEIPARRRSCWLRQGFRSAVMLPLRREDGRTLAVLTLFFDRKGEFSSAFIRQSKAVAEVIAYGLERSFLYEDLLELQQLIRHLVEFVTDALIITDELGRIRFVSQRAVRLFRKTRKTLQDRLIFQLGLDSDDALETALRRVRRRARPYFFEFGFHPKKTAPLYLQASVARIAMKRSQGEVLVWTFRDVTSLRNATADVRRKEKELEDFVYTVSHDLKAPLVSLQGYLSLLKEKIQDGADSQVRHYLERLDSNAFAIQRMIQDLLELSRVSRTRRDVGMHPISRLIRQALDEFRFQIEKKRIFLRVQKRFPRLYCDARGLRLVFSNLIGNAIKFMGDQTHPTIEIGCKKVGDTYLFSVRDNGTGIAPEDQRKVFDIFYRGKSTGATEGSGVGLAIARKVVEDHGGRIWIESRPGEGTSVFFSIPANVTAVPLTGKADVQ